MLFRIPTNTSYSDLSLNMLSKHSFINLIFLFTTECNLATLQLNISNMNLGENDCYIYLLK